MPSCFQDPDGTVRLREEAGLDRSGPDITLLAVICLVAAAREAVLVLLGLGCEFATGSLWMASRMSQEWWPWTLMPTLWWSGPGAQVWYRKDLQALPLWETRHLALVQGPGCPSLSLRFSSLFRVNVLTYSGSGSP